MNALANHAKIAQPMDGLANSATVLLLNHPMDGLANYCLYC